MRGRVFCVLREPIKTPRGRIYATGVREAPPHLLEPSQSINVSYESSARRSTNYLRTQCVCMCVCLGVTDCQRRGLRCSEAGDFLPAQSDALSGRWSCFNSEGAELDWTRSNLPLTDDDCSGDKQRKVNQSETRFSFFCMCRYRM